MAEAAESIVSARGLTRSFGEGEAKVTALRDADLDIREGEFTAIMGPSGSGKSTLMHLLAGLDKPSSGTVQLAGKAIGELNDKQLTLLRRDQVGFVFQSFNLLPVLTAGENIDLPLSISGKKPDPEWRAKVVESMGIEDRLSHKPSELSGGQQQRVAVARALLSKPAVVFADEPTGNLDSTSGQEVLDLLRRSVDQMGQTIVMVTHDPAAAAIADRLILLKDGRIVYDGEAESQEQIFSLMQSLGA